MCFKDLASSGYAIADTLEELSYRFHVKSREYDLLMWEASIIRLQSDDLIHHSGCADSLAKSRLASDYGKRLADQFPNETRRVEEFHELYLLSKMSG
jgi:hypothetical protein